MNKHYLRLMAVLSWVLLLRMSVAAWAQDGIVNARGNWTIYSRNIENGELVTKHVQITQDGNSCGDTLRARISLDRSAVL